MSDWLMHEIAEMEREAWDAHRQGRAAVADVLWRWCVRLTDQNNREGETLE